MSSDNPPIIDRIPPHAFFFVSAVFHYLGPAFAVLLFAQVEVRGVAWLRIASAGLIFGIWRRPWRIIASQSWKQRRTLGAFGLVLALMNVTFYEAIARLPLGTVGAIEFIGPILLAALGTRTPRNATALLLAASGGFVLTDARFGGQPLGYVYAFANCALFMLYVVLGHRIAQDGRTGRDRPPGCRNAGCHSGDHSRRLCPGTAGLSTVGCVARRNWGGDLLFRHPLHHGPACNGAALARYLCTALIHPACFCHGDRHIGSAPDTYCRRNIRHPDGCSRGCLA